jgi:hypothetical protein
VKRLLLLGAPSQGVTLEEVARAYSGPGLIGCILTKIDEALTYGPVLDVAIRHELPVHYVTNGQRVPEDLHLANATYLADRAFRINQPESPFTQDENDYPILMAAAQQTAASPDLNDRAPWEAGVRLADPLDQASGLRRLFKRRSRRFRRWAWSGRTCAATASACVPWRGGWDGAGHRVMVMDEMRPPQ